MVLLLHGPVSLSTSAGACTDPVPVPLHTRSHRSCPCATAHMMTQILSLCCCTRGHTDPSSPRAHTGTHTPASFPVHARSLEHLLPMPSSAQGLLVCVHSQGKTSHICNIQFVPLVAGLESYCRSCQQPAKAQGMSHTCV